MASRVFIFACLILCGCEGLGKEALIQATVKGCSNTSKERKDPVPLNCDCIVRNAVSDMSFEELMLWSKTPELFDADEIQVLLLRKAVTCLEPQLVASCVKSGGSQAECACIASQVLAEFSGEELHDISERMRNGSAVAPAAARIKLDCARRFGKGF